MSMGASRVAAMPRVMLTGSIRQHVGGLGSVDADGTTAREVICALEAAYPGLRGWITDERGVLRRHVRLFLGSEAIPLDAPLESGVELHIVAAISGG